MLNLGVVVGEHGRVCQGTTSPPPVNTRVLQLPLAGQPLLLSSLLYKFSQYIYVRALSWAIDEKGGSCSIANKGTDCAEFESRLST